VSLKPFFCRALDLLKLHRPDCQRRAAQNCSLFARQRLMDLIAHSNLKDRNRLGVNVTSSENDAA
jgi:hypothetical protein